MSQSVLSSVLRVLIVEDSPTDRELLVSIFNSDPEIEVVGQATDGVDAVRLAVELRPSLITMDIHMPRMDGLEATRQIMVHAPTPILLVSSSTLSRDLELSFEAMQMGALAVVEKPGFPGAPPFESRRANLLALAKSLSQVRLVRRWPSANGREAPTRPPLVARPGRSQARVIAVAASTGGPAALRQVLAALPADLPVPTLVVQHIARGFVAGLVEWLRLHCALRVTIAQDGEPAARGTIYIAPDDRHLGLGPDGRLRVTAQPAIDGFRPSGTYLFRSIADVYGAGTVAVILTGMGSDGVDGLRAVKAAGGIVIAQDEFTSVVYGMPREAVKAGVVDAELPVTEIAARLTSLVAWRRHDHHDPDH